MPSLLIYQLIVYLRQAVTACAILCRPDKGIKGSGVVAVGVWRQG